MPTPSELIPIRRTLNAAVVNAAWAPGNDPTYLPGLRGALDALDHPERRLTPRPRDEEGIRGWMATLATYRRTGFHCFDRGALYAFTPVKEGWVCARVGRAAEVRILEDPDGIGVPAAIGGGAATVGDVWSGGEVAPLDTSLPPAVAATLSWDALLDHAIATWKGQGRPQELTALLQCRKSMVSSNRHLDELLGRPDAAPIRRSLRAQGFSLRGEEGLWTLRWREAHWEVTWWDHRAPGRVRLFTIPARLLNLDQGSWSAARIDAHLNVLTEQPLDRHPPAGQPAPPVADLPEPVAPVVEPEPVDRAQWAVLVQRALDERRQARLAATTPERQDALAQDSQDLRALLLAAMGQMDILTGPHPVRDATWDLRARAFLRSEVVLEDKYGLWVVRADDGGWRVCGWSSRRPNDVTRRVLTTLLVDPLDRAWPPQELSMTLRAADEALRGDAPENPQVPVDTGVGSKAASQSPTLQDDPAGSIQRMVESAPSDTSGADWFTVLSDARVAVETLNSDNYVTQRILEHLKVVQASYVLDNASLERVLNRSRSTDHIKGIRALYRDGFTLRALHGLWVVQKRPHRWFVRWWDVRTPQHVMVFDVLANQLRLGIGIWTVNQIDLTLQELGGFREPGGSAPAPVAPTEFRVTPPPADQAQHGESDTETNREILGSEDAQYVSRSGAFGAGGQDDVGGGSHEPLETSAAPWLTVLADARDALEVLDSDDPEEQRLLEHLKVVQASYVLDNAALDRVLGAADRLKYLEGIRGLYRMGFTLRAAHGLWVVRKRARTWFVRWWDVRTPQHVMVFEVPVVQLALDRDTWTCGQIDRKLQELGGVRVEDVAPLPPVTLVSAASPRSTAPDPVTVVVQSEPPVTPVPSRSTWPDLITVGVQRARSEREVTGNPARWVDLDRDVHDWTALFGAARRNGGLLHPPAVRPTATWIREVAALLKTGFGTEDTVGLHVFQPLSRGWAVCSWRSSEPDTLIRRTLQTLVVDPLDSAWPPSELRSRLVAAQKVAETPPSAVGEWRSLLADAIEGHRQRRASPASGGAPRRVMLAALAGLARDYQSSNAHLPATITPEWLWETRRFMVRGDRDLWLLQRSRTSWRVTHWTPAAPDHAQVRLLGGDPPAADHSLEELIAALTRHTVSPPGRSGEGYPPLFPAEPSGAVPTPPPGAATARRPPEREPAPALPPPDTRQSAAAAPGLAGGGASSVPVERASWSSLLSSAYVAAYHSALEKGDDHEGWGRVRDDLQRMRSALLKTEWRFWDWPKVVAPEDQAAWFEKRHGQRFTLEGAEGFVLLERRHDGWTLYRWSSAEPAVVRSGVLDSSFGGPLDGMPNDLQMKLTVVRDALATRGLSAPLNSFSSPNGATQPEPPTRAILASWGVMVQRRLDALGVLDQRRENIEATVQGLGRVAAALNAPETHLLPLPRDPGVRAAQLEHAGRIMRSGTFTLVQWDGVRIFRRWEDGWMVVEWTPEHHGQAPERHLTLRLQDPADPSWPPQALAEWVAALAPAAEGAMTVTPRPPKPPSLLAVLDRAAGRADAQTAPRLLQVRDALLNRDTHLGVPPDAPLERVAWEERLVRLGREGAFTVVGTDGVWGFDRAAEGWSVQDWRVAAPGVVTERHVNADFLDPGDAAWPPEEVEAQLEWGALELQGHGPAVPEPRLVAWAGGGFRLFREGSAPLGADGMPGPVAIQRGEKALADVARHVLQGGTLWTVPTGLEAGSVQARLAPGTVRVDVLLTVLGAPPPQGAGSPGQWGVALPGAAAAVRAAVSAAPDWQKHLLRGVWGLKDSQEWAPAFADHVETLDAYLDVDGAVEAAAGPLEGRVPLLGVLGWLTRLDDEGVAGREPYFHLHGGTHALARQLTHPPITTPGQLLQRVRFRFQLEAREEQLQGLTAVMARPGVHLLTLPTGAGKSLVYWAAADVLSDVGGATVIVSPLQALIADQVRDARAAGLAADAVTGRQDAAQRLLSVDAYRTGGTALLYVTPEQLARFDVQQALQARPPELWVFDEAHTLTQWGAAFRPSCRQAAETVVQFGQQFPRVLLTTATLTQEEERALGAVFAPLGPLQVSGTPFTLPEQLRLEITPHEDENARVQAMYEALNRARLAREQAIVYCVTPGQAEGLARRLASFFPNGQVAAYHGQLPEDARRALEGDFLSKRVAFLVATAAFGLGMNNPGVRLVIHAFPPASIEEYVQQIGRATRQDEPARALLLCSPRDLELQFRLQASQLLQREDYRRVFRALRERVRALPDGQTELWHSALEVGLLSRLEGDTRHVQLKGELALHRLAAEGVLHLTTLTPTPLTITDTSDAREGDVTLEPGSPAHTLWGHLQAPGCDSSSVPELARALRCDPDTLLATLCTLQEAGYLRFDYPIRTFINKGTRVGGLRAATQRLFSVQGALLAHLQALPAPEGASYPLPMAPLLTELGERLGGSVTRQDLTAALRCWEVLGWARASTPGSAASLTVTFTRPPDAAAFARMATRGAALQGATEQLVELLYTRAPTGRSVPAEVGYQELHRLFGGEESPARLLNLLHRLGLLTLGSGSDLRALGQAITYHPGTDRTLTTLDYAGLHLDNARRFARLHLVEALIGCPDEAAVRILVGEYFTRPLEDVLTARRGITLKDAPPCRLDDLRRIQELNGEQRLIVDSRERALLVVAGPGSGKTRTVVHRVAHLLRVERVPAQKILVVAFNRAAVRELKARLFELVGSDTHDVDILTFHALALRILNVNLADLARQTGLSKGKALEKALASALEQLRGEDRDDGEERALLESFRGRYDYVLIDEYQDIDDKQYEVVRLLVGHGQGEDKERARYNLWAVGDDDQTLYQFRGAKPQFLQQFESEYDTRRRVLVRNHRSLPGITQVANQLIARSGRRTKAGEDEQVRPVRSTSGQPEVLYHQLEAGNGARGYIVSEIARLLGSDPTLKPEDIAVLAPRWNALASTWATLQHLGIPSRLLRGGSPLPPALSTHVQAILAATEERSAGLRSGYRLHQELQDAQARVNVGLHAPSVQRLLRAGQLMDEERAATGLIDTPVLARSLITDLREFLGEPDAVEDGTDGVTLSTFHSAKGLEFKVVFVVGSDPYYPKKVDRAEQWEAHLRAHYVAITRAKDLVYLIDLPGTIAEFIPRPPGTPGLHVAPRYPQLTLPTHGQVRLTYDRFGDVYLGHHSTVTRRVQAILEGLRERPVTCACDVEQQFAGFGRTKPVLTFRAGDGEVGALSRSTSKELLSIFPQRHWQGATVRLLEATHFENDEGKQYLVPVVDVTLQTAFG